MAENDETRAQQKGETALNEEKTLQFWKEQNIFKKTLEKKSTKGEFIFYEGPPTANGKPGIHHLEARAFKDIIPRYKTMQGYSVPRKGGWDTHGLPVELQVEKKLGLKSKKEIEAYGVEAFNKECKSSVWEYVDLWARFTDRIGFWVDLENPYVTYEKTFMESVWNVIKEVDKKKLLYKDYRVVPWCTRCGTALSSHELAQGYEEVKDLSVYIKFKVKGQDSTYLLAWTTTPWTLPGNVGLAVGEKVEYVKVKVGNEIHILAKSRLSVLGEGFEEQGSVDAKELIGLSYEPLFPYLSEKFGNKNPEAFKNAYKVYPADFVTTEDGTGIVHTAVMYGQEDFELGTKVGLPKFHLVNEDGHFQEGMGFLSGRYVKEKNEDGKPTLDVDIIDDLKKRNLFFKQENYKHTYPHCWRCKTPLIYYARDSWYIRMSDLRDKLVKENEKINWEPSHIKEGRFGEWLKEVKDWAISRERYWGTPMPIWEDKDGNRVVIGSVKELKSRIKKRNNYFLIRHGQAKHNLNGTISSSISSPNPLTEKGKAQIVKSASQLKNKNIDVIITSPFERAKETTNIIIKEIGFKGTVVEENKIRELSVEDWDNKKWTEYHAQFKDVFDQFKTHIGSAENWEDVRRRVTQCMYEIDAKYEGKNILIVSHGGPLNLIALSALGYDIKQIASHYNNDAFGNGEVNEVDWRNLPHNDIFEIDLHKPYIDTVTLVDEKGNQLKRVKEVMDVWLDSGAMPFAQYHYPFEATKKLFSSTQNIPYPADFISEAIDQTRGWFYTLHAVGVLMGKGHAYNNVICLGHILDAQGKKMSKSLGNIVDPWLMMDKYGVDALRMWMYTVNQPGDSKNFDERTVDEIVKKIFNLITNILSFYEMYADDSITASSKSSHVLDKWIISRLNQLVGEGTESLDKYQVFEAGRGIRDLVGDFSTWYIRRSRDRFKSDDLEDKKLALSTTKFVLQELAKYMAPFTPFFAEAIYQKVKEKNGQESVHLENWPTGGKVDEKIITEMQKVRDVVSLALDVRQKANIKVRQPLSRMTVVQDFSKEFADIIKDEVNVKEIEVGEKLELDTQITSELKEEGEMRDLVRSIQDLRKQASLTPNQKIALYVTPDKENLANKYMTELMKISNVQDVKAGDQMKIEVI